MLFNAKPFRTLTQIHGFVINSGNIGSYIALAATKIRKLYHRIISIKLDVATRHHRSVHGVNIQFYCNIRKEIVIHTLGCIELLSHTAWYLEKEVNKLLILYNIDRRNIYCFTSYNGAIMISLRKMLRRLQHDQILSAEMKRMQENRVDSSASEDSKDDSEGELQGCFNEETGVLKLNFSFTAEDGLSSLLKVFRCAAHTLQLAVHDSLAKIPETPINRIRTVVKNLRSSKFLDLVPESLKSLRLNVLCISRIILMNVFVKNLQ